MSFDMSFFFASSSKLCTWNGLYNISPINYLVPSSLATFLHCLLISAHPPLPFTSQRKEGSPIFGCPNPQLSRFVPWLTLDSCFVLWSFYFLIQAPLNNISLTLDPIVFQFHRLPTVRPFTAPSRDIGYTPSSGPNIRWTLHNPPQPPLASP